METTTINPLDNPAASNAQVKGILASSLPGPPVIVPPPLDLVSLPGGLCKDQKVARTAIVRELTGEHEEQLARASQSANAFHFMDTLLACGVRQIGDYHEDRTRELLKDLLVGDREALILEVRRATYGDSIDVAEWACPECGNKTDLHIDLDDIPVVRMGDPQRDTTFTVALRRGKSASVRLANGHDQAAIFDNDKLTQAERDTVLLSRCVSHITDAEGRESSMAVAPSLARKMSIPDRRSILREMAKRQPGPRYNDVKFTHEDCGKQVSLSVGIGDLFLDN